ncbi:putative TMV resistance protein N-like [Capsicum annuum]|nr:putative TMV resistance protein N-like [Capsicum annuum]
MNQLLEEIKISPSTDGPSVAKNNPYVAIDIAADEGVGCRESNDIQRDTKADEGPAATNESSVARGKSYVATNYISVATDETPVGIDVTVVLDHPSEFLTSMRGFHDVGLLDTPIYLRSVTFGTNKGTYGPYGMKISVNYKVKEFNFPVGVDRTFGGFHGTEHGHSIESIGVYVKAITSSMIAPRPHPRRIVVKREQD